MNFTMSAFKTKLGFTFCFMLIFAAIATAQLKTPNTGITPKAANDAPKDPVPTRKGETWTYSGIGGTYDDAKPFFPILQSKTTKTNVKGADGKFIIDPKTKKPTQKDTTFIEEIDAFAAVQKDGKWGYIRRDGKPLIPPKYYIANDFTNNYAVVALGTEVPSKENPDETEIKFQYGVIDRTGREVVPAKYDLMNNIIRDGIVTVTKLETQLSGFVEVATNKLIADFKYTQAHDFNDGMAAFERVGKWGFIDKTGKEVIPPQYGKVYDFNEGLAKAYLIDKWGFIDKKGNLAIRYQYQDPGASYGMFINGLAKVRLNNLEGWIDHGNNKRITFKYAEARDFSEKMAAVKINGKWGFINVFDKVVIQPQFAAAQDFKEGLAPAMQGNLWGFIDKSGKFVISPRFNNVGERGFERGIALVEKNGQNFYVDKTGKEYVN
jgi:hypothetical protein